MYISPALPWCPVQVHLTGPSMEALSNHSVTATLHAWGGGFPAIILPVTRQVSTDNCWYASDASGHATRGAAGAGGVVRFSVDMMKATLGGLPPQLWSAEQPNLHALVLELRDNITQVGTGQWRLTAYHCKPGGPRLALMMMMMMTTGIRGMQLHSCPTACK